MEPADVWDAETAPANGAVSASVKNKQHAV